MNSRKLAESSTLSFVREPSSSQTTGSTSIMLRFALELGGRFRDLGVDLLDRDRALVVDVELAQVGDHDARILAGDVAEQHVSLGPSSRALEVDEVADRVRVLQQLERVAAPGNWGRRCAGGSLAVIVRRAATGRPLQDAGVRLVICEPMLICTNRSSPRNERRNETPRAERSEAMATARRRTRSRTRRSRMEQASAAHQHPSRRDRPPIIQLRDTTVVYPGGHVGLERV